MSNRTIEAILRLSAKLGSMVAFDKMASKIDQVDRRAKAFNQTQSLMGRGATRLGRTLASSVAAGAVVAATKEVVTNFATAERRLNRIAINADAGKEALGSMFAVVNRSANQYAMTQDQVTDGLETLVASGRSVEQALAFLPSVTATAQAAGAEITDIATTADSVSSSFDIAADKMQRAFDILVKSGKQGKFELKDMAQYLPTLAPAMSALGYKGEEGLKRLSSMLQTIRLRTGSAGEAATAMQNVLQKMESNETTKKFASFGIDLRKELAKARKEGKDVLDVFVQLTEKATKGDLSKIPQLFTDAQLQVGMRALVQGKDAFKEFLSDLKTVDGSTIKDLGKVLDDNQAKIDRMGSSWERFKRSLGSAIAPAATTALEKVASGFDRLEGDRMGLDKYSDGDSKRRSEAIDEYYKRYDEKFGAPDWYDLNAKNNRELARQSAFAAYANGAAQSPYQEFIEDEKAARKSSGPERRFTHRKSSRERAPATIPTPTPRPIPAREMTERGRLISAYAQGNGHNYVNSPRVRHFQEQAARDAESRIPKPSPLSQSSEDFMADMRQKFGGSGQSARDIAKGGEDAASSLKAGAVQTAAEIVNGAKAGGETLKASSSDAGNVLGKSAVDAIMSMAGQIGTAIGQGAAPAISNAVKTAAKSSSPVVRADTGKSMPGGGIGHQ